MDTGIELYILNLKAKNLELKNIEEKTMEQYSCSRKTFYNYWKKIKNLSEKDVKTILDGKGAKKYDFGVS